MTITIFFSLDFIRIFLRQIGESDEEANTCTVCQHSYSESLAQFHPWYIRQAAMLAMHALPARKDLLLKVKITIILSSFNFTLNSIIIFIFIDFW